MDATCDDPEHETKALLESGRIAISSGCRQTGRVARTRNALASITETELSPRLETSTVEPSGETRANPGEEPTRTWPIAIRLSRSITLTLDEPELATYARLPSCETSTWYGRPYTPRLATTVFDSASMMLRLLDPVLTT